MGLHAAASLPPAASQRPAPPYPRAGYRHCHTAATTLPGCLPASLLSPNLCDPLLSLTAHTLGGPPNNSPCTPACTKNLCLAPVCLPPEFHRHCTPSTGSPSLPGTILQARRQPRMAAGHGRAGCSRVCSPASDRCATALAATRLGGGPYLYPCGGHGSYSYAKPMPPARFRLLLSWPALPPHRLLKSCLEPPPPTYARVAFPSTHTHTMSSSCSTLPWPNRASRFMDNPQLPGHTLPPPAGHVNPSDSQ